MCPHQAYTARTHWSQKVGSLEVRLYKMVASRPQTSRSTSSNKQGAKGSKLGQNSELWVPIEGPDERRSAPRATLLGDTSDRPSIPGADLGASQSRWHLGFCPMRGKPGGTDSPS